MDIIDNGNLTSNELNKGRLNLNPRGLVNLLSILLGKLKSLQRLDE